MVTVHRKLLSTSFLLSSNDGFLEDHELRPTETPSHTIIPVALCQQGHCYSTLSRGNLLLSLLLLSMSAAEIWSFQLCRYLLILLRRRSCIYFYLRYIWRSLLLTRQFCADTRYFQEQLVQQVFHIYWSLLSRLSLLMWYWQRLEHLSMIIYLQS